MLSINFIKIKYFFFLDQSDKSAAFLRERERNFSINFINASLKKTLKLLRKSLSLNNFKARKFWCLRTSLCTQIITKFELESCDGEKALEKFSVEFKNLKKILILL